MRNFAYALLFFFSAAAADDLIHYDVQIRGDLTDKTVEKLKTHTQLFTLRSRPPATFSGLKRRADADITNVVKILQSLAYYDARVSLSYNFDLSPPTVFLNIIPGSIYPIDTVEVIAASEGDPLPEEEAIGQLFAAAVGKPALPATIYALEKELIQTLASRGYPYASVNERAVNADQSAKSVALIFYLQSGPLAYFGETSVVGSRTVKEGYFRKHIAWKRGEIYCPTLVERTLQRLELSQLFSSVTITYPQPPLSNSQLPMIIEVNESKLRSIGIGVNYASQRGPGFSGEWEHRNFCGKGEVLTARTNLWHDEQFAKISYLQPDIFCYRQNLLWLAELYREKTEGYTTQSLSFSTTLSLPTSKYSQLAYGLKFMYLHDTDVHDEKIHQNQRHDSDRFHILKLPITYTFNCTDDVLDPTKGWRYRLKSEPSCQLLGSPFFYSINVLRASRYWTFSKRPFLTFAAATTIGSIPGPGKTTLPRSELFDAGTDTLLRGYRYKSVSPLDNEYDPTGGRSMLISTAEIRWRMSEEIGWVLFYDFGNVYNSILPDLKDKILQSAGLGFRYYTPVGPIRLDVAFPLTPRKHVDKSCFQAYLSIGQTF